MKTGEYLMPTMGAVKKKFWGGEFWTGWHFVAPVVERGGWEVVERYVPNQGKSQEALRQLPMF